MKEKNSEENSIFPMVFFSFIIISFFIYLLFENNYYDKKFEYFFTNECEKLGYTNFQMKPSRTEFRCHYINELGITTNTSDYIFYDRDKVNEVIEELEINE